MARTKARAKRERRPRGMVSTGEGGGGEGGRGEEGRGEETEPGMDMEGGDYVED